MLRVIMRMHSQLYYTQGQLTRIVRLLNNINRLPDQPQILNEFAEKRREALGSYRNEWERSGQQAPVRHPSELGDDGID